MRTVQVGIESVDQALLQGAVWWVRYGKPAALEVGALVERKAARLRLKVRRALAKAPSPVSEGRGAKARGFAPARFLRSLAKKVNHARR
jgi:hypothetical protein